MRFADVIADGGIKTRLSEMADSGMLGHALMLHEDEGGGALALTVALAQYLLCKDHKDGDSCGTCNTCSRVERLIYPDLHFVFPFVFTSDASLLISMAFFFSFRALRRRCLICP